MSSSPSVRYEWREGRITERECRVIVGGIAGPWRYTKTNAKTDVPALRATLAQKNGGEQAMAANTARRVRAARLALEYDRRVSP